MHESNLLDWKRKLLLPIAILLHDLFGHSIQMNLMGRGPEHNTLLGSIFSIMYKVMIAYVIANRISVFNNTEGTEMS